MAILMALKSSPPNSSKSWATSESHMRNSIRLLIGLTMPGLALAAVWLWVTRRARGQQSNHGNGSEVPRDPDRDTSDKWLGTGKDCAPATRGSDMCVCQVSEIAPNRVNDPEESSASEMGFRDVQSDMKYSSTQTENSSKQGAERSTFASNALDLKSNASGVEVSQIGFFKNSPEKNKNLVSFDTSDTESAELSVNDKTSIHTETAVEINALSNSSSESQNFKRGENASSQSEDGESKNINNISNSNSTDASGSEPISDNQKNGNASKKGTTSRTQSLDEYSDVSSGDGPSDSPLDPGIRSTAGSDIENAQPEDEVTWELEFPQALCGRLIGKKGKNVQKISQITGTKIRLIPQKDNTEFSQRLVSLTGSPKQLKLALKALREKFPSVPFTRLNGRLQHDGATTQECALTPSIVCVALPENELCQVFVTNIVDANHFYVQHSDHSIHALLRQLDQQMSHCYGNTAGSMLVQATNTGMLCASLSPSGWWWRAQVVGLLMKPDEVEIAWLDYGGRTTVPTAMLRQLRSDFMQLPFQAVECYLSNIVPNHGESAFSMAACALFEQLTQNVILTARVTSYTRDCPNLELYLSDQWTGQPIFINRELVFRGFARWSET